MFYQGAERRVSNVGLAGLENKSSVAVYLEKNAGPYDAGDVIRGHVEVDIKKEIKVKGMRLQISGAARVLLDNEKTTHYKGVSIDKTSKHFETILDHRIQLLKKDPNLQPSSPTGPSGRKKSIFSCAPSLLDDSESFVISPGTNKYPFEFLLPRSLPSSYEGKFGSIYYGIKLTVEKFTDIERFASFLVKGNVDLNDDLDLLKPVSTTYTKSYSRLCLYAQKNLTVQLAIIRGAFVPGEPVQFIARVINESHKRLKSIKIALVQIVMYRTGAQTKKSTNILQMCQGEPVGAYQTKRWDQECFTMPWEVQPSGACKSIQIRYLINVNVHLGLMDDDLNVTLPLIVGTVAFNPVTAQRHLAQLRQTDPGVIRLLGEFNANSGGPNAGHRESLTVSRQDSTHSNLSVPKYSGVDGRRRSTGSAINEESPANKNPSPVKRMSTGSKNLTVAEARRVRLSNSNLTSA